MTDQLFLVDPVAQLRPEKDSSVALMQAAARAGRPVWVAGIGDLAAAIDGPRVLARPITPEPWCELGEPCWRSLTAFAHVWMRKDPPVDEAYLYATHLLELAEIGRAHV